MVTAEPVSTNILVVRSPTDPSTATVVLVAILVVSAGE